MEEIMMAGNALGDGGSSDRTAERRLSPRTDPHHERRRGVATSGEMALQGPFGHPATQCMPQRLVRLVGYRAPAHGTTLEPIANDRETA
ncbi:hypothetical protein [Rhodopseudomonas palustris]|uniref:hypothetical protein n=1 Tax=Rhodopseudomonas palustris TaxID=1076 RepID=UPI001F2003EB|nr:hypothetical protein [Rhodopseudomonas palustris]